MLEIPIIVAVAVLLAVGFALLLIAIFGFGDRVIFVLLMVFFASAGSALWCTFSKDKLTDYAVWSMYFSGIALMVLMVRSLLPKKTTAAKLEPTKPIETAPDIRPPQ